MQYLDFLKKNWAVFFIFFILIFIIYGQSLSGDFVFDDRNIIEHLPILSDIKNIDQVALHPFWTIENGLYRPTTLLSYSFNIALLGTSAFSFHLLNLLLYVFICFLIYLIIKKLFRNEFLAFITALLFLVLPIHTEVVANISGRGELLALFFSLLFIRELIKEKINFYLLFLWTLLAVGSKEIAIAIFPIMFLILLIKEKNINIEILKKHFKNISASVIAVCFYFFLRFFSLGINTFPEIQTSLIENPLLFTDTTSRIATAFKILWLYFEKTFWPIGLCSDYSYNQIPIIHNFLNLEVILGVIIFSFSIILLIYFLKKKPLISLGLGIFIFSFLIVSNIIFPIGTIMGERLFFFPSLGLSLIFAFIFYQILIALKNKNAKIVWLALLTITLIIYSAISLKRQSVWLSEENLFLSAVQCAPNSVLSRSNSGAIYLIKGNLAKAEEELKTAINIKPIYSKGLNNLGLLYYRQGKTEQARELYLEAIKQDFPYGGAFENLIILYLNENKIDLAKHWLTYLYGDNKELVDTIVENYLKELKQ
jgi:hypothetical protein